MLHQTFDIHDLFAILVLVVLEGVLSIDNALVLGILARRLPHGQRTKALTYGLLGALVFRVVAILLASWLLRTRFVKLIGGVYLIYLNGKYFFQRKPDDEPTDGRPAKAGHFWRTVVAIELTDLAFAVDSILAAVALVAEQNTAGPVGRIHPKLWVVVTGGMIGVVIVRVAAAAFIRLLDRFAGFELAAYLLVLLIGLKLVIDWAANVPGEKARVDFQNPHGVMFWVFWISMALCFCVGFLPKRATRQAADAHI